MWLVDRDAFAKLTEWLFEKQPRTPEEARAYAISLVTEGRSRRRRRTSGSMKRFIAQRALWFSLDRNPFIPKVLLTHDVRDTTLRNDVELFVMLECGELKIKPQGRRRGRRPRLGDAEIACRFTRWEGLGLNSGHAYFYCSPTVILAAGNKPKVIQEFVRRVICGLTRCSVAG